MADDLHNYFDVAEESWCSEFQQPLSSKDGWNWAREKSVRTWIKSLSAKDRRPFLAFGSKLSAAAEARWDPSTAARACVWIYRVRGLVEYLDALQKYVKFMGAVPGRHSLWLRLLALLLTGYNSHQNSSAERRLLPAEAILRAVNGEAYLDADDEGYQSVESTCSIQAVRAFFWAVGYLTDIYTVDNLSHRVHMVWNTAGLFAVRVLNHFILTFALFNRRTSVHKTCVRAFRLTGKVSRTDEIHWRVP